MIRFIVCLVFLTASALLSAHPTGTMIFDGKYLLWSYVCPIGSATHTACVMIWDENEGARPWIISTKAVSDWMIAKSNSNDFILIERFHSEELNEHYYRVVKARPPSKDLVEITPWKKDEFRMGEGGFVPIGENDFIFARYPRVYNYSVNRGVTSWLPGKKLKNINRISQVISQDGKSNILAKSDNKAWLLDQSGSVLKKWENLLEKDVLNPPFMGNRIFDIAYSEDNLWLAYWGARRFDVIRGAKRETIANFNNAFLPHAVASANDEAFVLASTIEPGNDVAIEPLLFRFKNKTMTLIWGREEHRKAMKY